MVPPPPHPPTMALISLCLAQTLAPGEGTCLVVQWLRLCTSTAGGMGSIPGQGTKIPHTQKCEC